MRSLSPEQSPNDNLLLVRTWTTESQTLLVQFRHISRASAFRYCSIGPACTQHQSLIRSASSYMAGPQPTNAIPNTSHRCRDNNKERHTDYSKTQTLNDQRSRSGLGRARAQTENERRGSILRSRSRSGTFTLTRSPNPAPTWGSSTTSSSRGISQNTVRSSVASSQERSESSAKALLSKGGRILKRQGSKLSLLSSTTSGQDGNDANGQKRAASGVRRQRSKSASSGSEFLSFNSRNETYQPSGPNKT